jgi:type IV secretion system protein VirD4
LIPHANAARSPTLKAPPWVGVILRAVVASIAVLVLAQYLAGLFFLWLSHLSLSAAGPFTVARYAHYYGDRADIQHRVWIASGLGVLTVALCIFPLIVPRQRSLHGDARFATRREMARAGLFAETGLFLGRPVGGRRRYLVLRGQQGMLVSAPPRSDKGTAIVCPNLLFFLGSVICLDVKLENWTITAGFRARVGQACYLFNPLAEDGNTACWNPLAYVSKDPNLCISDVQRIAATLYPEIPGTDPFWSSGARSYFLGVTLYVLETPSLPPTLGEVLRQGMASDTEGFGHHWRRIVEGRQKGRFPLSSQCVRALSEIIDLAPVTASSIRKTFTSRLDLFANPLIDRATARNDFDLRKLRKEPMSIFLGINPGDLSLLQPLLNLFIEQALNLQTKELPEHNPVLIYQVAFFLDEAAAIGRIPILAKSVAYLPGYNVRLILVLQAFSQLREIYGPQNAETMMKSLAVRIVYAPKDVVEASEISNELGMTTVKVRTHSRPMFDFSGEKGGRRRSVSISEQKRPLLLPQEVKELGKDREVIFYEGIRPILARKNRYYQDPFFRKRLFPPPAQATPAPRGPERRPTPPAPPVDQNVATDGEVLQPENNVIAPEIDELAPAVREATSEDIDRLESLTLEDFDVDFDRVQVPPKPDGERLTSQELNAAVESFLDTLRDR